jgi:hypothetical protein
MNETSARVLVMTVLAGDGATNSRAHATKQNAFRSEWLMELLRSVAQFGGDGKAEGQTPARILAVGDWI